MDDYLAVEGDMLDSQGQMDEMEVEHEPPISYIDFFARDNEVTNMVDNEIDQSDIAYIDFFAQGNQKNYVTDHVVDQHVEQSHISFIDFFARDDQTNHVADHVTDQRAEQSNLYYDFFNIDNQLNPAANVVEQSVWNTDYYALENQRSAGADPVEQSVQNIDRNTDPENQLCAAANVGERSVPYIDYIALSNPLNAASNAVEQSVGNIDYFAQENHSQNIDYLAPENHQQSAAGNVVEQSVQDIDYNAPENQLSAAANVREHELVPEIDYITLANQLNAAAAVFEQSVGNIDHDALGNHLLWNIVYYDPENHRLGIAANIAEHSVQDTDYYALENQPSGAANVAEQSVQEVDYIAVANELRAAAIALEQSVQDTDYIDIENQPSVQSDYNFRVMEENGEMGMNDFQDGLVFRIRFVRGQDVGHSDDHSDHDEDAIPEFEQIPDDDPPFDEHPASRSVVRNLASVIFTQESVERNTVACAVCMDEFNVGEMAKKLPCSHYFHEECILPWLDLQNTCPVCRYQLPIGDDSDDEREENERASTE